jgi:anti-sigma B factor antagonist
MEITTRKIKNFTVITISGSMLAENELEFSKQLEKIVNDGALHLVLNLSQVRTLTSYNIGIILKTWKKLTAMHGTLDIVLENTEVRRTFRSLNLDTVIKIFDSEEQFSSEALSDAREDITTQIRQKGVYQILDIKEPLNIFLGYKELDNRISTLFTKGHKFIALNLADIVHIYSEVIGMMIKWQKIIKNAGGFFCVLQLNEDLHERLTYLGMDKFLDLRLREEDL